MADVHELLDDEAERLMHAIQDVYLDDSITVA